MNTILAILAAITVSTKQLDTINNDDSVVTGVTSYFSESDTNDVNGLIAKYDETNLTERINAKQDTLVSGENIKTVNGETLLESGDIVISGMDEVRATNIVIGVMGDKFGLTVGTGLSTNFIYHTQKYEIIYNKFRFVGDEGGELQFIADSDLAGKIYTSYDRGKSRVHAKGSFRFEKSDKASDIKPDDTDIATLATASNIVASATNAVPRIVMGASSISADMNVSVIEGFTEWNPNYFEDPDLDEYKMYSNIVFSSGCWYIGKYFKDPEGGISEWTLESLYSADDYYVGEVSTRVDPNATVLKFKGGMITSTRQIEVTFTRLATTNDLINSYTKAETDTKIVSATSAVSNKVDQWENYWSGENVRLSITNYYGNTSGEPPRLRIEELDHKVTNDVEGVQIVSNVYRVVWDEVTRQTNYYNEVNGKFNSLSNNVMLAAWKQTNLQLVNKAPRAWQSVTSAGSDAPENTVWHTAPNTVFAGGTEWAHVSVGEGTISVLVDRGAPVYTEGEEGQFRFMDESGENYFGFDVREAYTIGCSTDGISVDNSLHMVALTYNLVASDNPTVLHCTNLTENAWSEATVTWEQNPPVGTKICYIDVGSNPQGFYKSQMVYAGGAKFVTNMQADLSGGIAATNQTLNVIQSVEPYIVNGQVLWRIKQ